MIGSGWRRDWACITPFLALPDGLRKAVYTTNTIEGLHRQIRKAIKTRGHFPDQQAATKLIESSWGGWRLLALEIKDGVHASRTHSWQADDASVFG